MNTEIKTIAPQSKELYKLGNPKSNLTPEDFNSPGYIVGNWIPRKKVMEFMNYGATQMASFEKTPGLIVSQVGKRKFIHRESLIKLLESHIINNISETN